MDPVWTIYFDGSSFGRGRRGGPGPSAGAAVVVSDQGEAFVKSRYLPRSDSDTAEYSGLLCGLEAAWEAGARSIVIRGDSRNVIDQITGRKQQRKIELLALGAEARSWLDRFQSWSIEWIPRAKNERADTLARSCIDEAF